MQRNEDNSRLSEEPKQLICVSCLAREFPSGVGLRCKINDLRQQQCKSQRSSVQVIQFF